MKSCTRKGRARAPRRSLSLEHLEARQLLAADLTGISPGLDADVTLDVSMASQFLQRAGRRHHAPPPDGSAGIPTSSAEPRTIDGTENNLANPEWGSTDEQLLRLSPANYDDGYSTPANADRPNARDVSNALAAHGEEDTPSDRQLSAFIYFWGQFLDHDIDLTLPPDEGGEAMAIAVPTGDAYFDPDGTGTQTMPFTRSRYDETTGTDADNPRQQINQITAWIDGSVVYGSDQETADSLRTFVGGKLRTGDDNLLPTGDDGFFEAGDVRANENVELTSMQTLFMREHNWWADRIAAQNPGLSDEAIYQQARAIVGAEMQVITYKEFLPALLGDNALEPYRGYDPTVNPDIANEFSTGAYRLGHSMINNDVEFFGDDGRAVFEEVELADAFMNPDLVRETGVDSILKYAASTLSEEIDNQVVDGLRNFLFGAPGQGGLDLASMNIQRGRDHGLADYNTVREYYGLPRMETFADISSNPDVQAALEEVYGSVDNIDLWAGSLAEDHVRGASVGELTRTILVDQFQRLRDGDRFWYQNVFSGREQAQLESTTLADVLHRNTTITNIQDNVFFLKAQVKGQVYYDTNGNGSQDRRETGMPGIKVELLNDEGEVVAATRTDRSGRYRFDQFRETGDYQVRLALPGFLATTSVNPQEFLISSGDVTVADIDFSVRWDFHSMFGNRNRTANSPAKVADTVFGELGQPAQQAQQSSTTDNIPKDDASDSGDDSRGLSGEHSNDSQASRDQHDSSVGTDFTSRPAGRGPKVSRAPR